MISVHAAADLLAQWWDAYACQQSKQFLKIPWKFRHYVVLLRLEKVEMVKHTGDRNLGEIEYWNLADKMPSELKGERLSRVRRVICPPEGVTVNRHQMSMYAKTVNRGLFRKRNHLDCQDSISPILISIAIGDVDLIGWDEHGRMKFTTEGSRNTSGNGIYSQ